jgi:hypothetical protein
MGSRGMFMSPWTLAFNLEEEITTAPVWVRLTYLSLVFWDESSPRDIGNKLGRYMYSYVRISVEMDLEKGLPEALQIKMDEWSHLHILDYDQISFKCHICHEYGHFAKIPTGAAIFKAKSKSQNRV